MVGYVIVARDAYGLSPQTVFFFLRPYGSAKCDLAILRDDLDVVAVRGKRLVIMDGLSNLLRDSAI